MKPTHFLFLLCSALLLACQQPAPPPAKNITSFIPEVLGASRYGNPPRDSLVMCWGNYYPAKKISVYCYLFNDYYTASVIYLPEKQERLLLCSECKNHLPDLRQFLIQNQIQVTSKELLEMFSQVALGAHPHYKLSSFYITPNMVADEYGEVADSCLIIRTRINTPHLPVLPSTHKACVPPSAMQTFSKLEAEIHRDFPPGSYYMSMSYEQREENAPYSFGALVVDRKNSLNFKQYGVSSTE